MIDTNNMTGYSDSLTKLHLLPRPPKRPKTPSGPEEVDISLAILPINKYTDFEVLNKFERFDLQFMTNDNFIDFIDSNLYVNEFDDMDTSLPFLNYYHKLSDNKITDLVARSFSNNSIDDCFNLDTLEYLSKTKVDTKCETMDFVMTSEPKIAIKYNKSAIDHVMQSDFVQIIGVSESSQQFNYNFGLLPKTTNVKLH